MNALDHINRYVSDVEKFINFYGDVLGYSLLDKGLKENGCRYAILEGNGHELFISEKVDFIQDKNINFRHIGYSVDNADEYLQILKLQGYAERNIEVIIKPYSKQFYIKDPDGLEIDMIQWTDKQEFYGYLKGKKTGTIID